MDYVEFISSLATEWPETRLKTLVLDFLRESCRWALEKKKIVESENNESRRKGMSYKDRQIYTSQINALEFLFEKWKHMGVEYSKKDIHLHELVTPEDMEYTQRIGIEHQIKTSLLFS